MALNQCNFLGNLGADPETKSLPSGESVTTFSVACTDKWKDKTSGETKESTEWVRCTCFGKRGEVIAAFFKKGDPIYVSGKMRTQTWEKDGVKHYSTGIVVSDFQFCGKRSATDNRTADQEKLSDTMPPAPDYDDDIPF